MLDGFQTRVLELLRLWHTNGEQIQFSSATVVTRCNDGGGDRMMRNSTESKTSQAQRPNWATFSHSYWGIVTFGFSIWTWDIETATREME